MDKFKYLLLCFFLATFANLLGDVPFLYRDYLIFYDSSNTLNTQAGPLSLKEEEVIKKVQLAISDASHGTSKLNSQILNLEGMSSIKNRHLLNNLCSMGNTHYLEIGCWKGSTFISALLNNQDSILSADAIDNWSEFEGPYLEFQKNCLLHIPNNLYNFHSQDCFSTDPKNYIKNKINIYFYDGGHSKEDQAKAFLFFNDVLDDLFIAIVDDSNWSNVREGTFEAFKKLNYKVLYEINLPARFNGDRDEWWNGFYVAVIRK